MVAALAAVVVGSAVAAIAGVLYGYVSLHNPLLVLNFIATLGLAFVTGLAATFGITLFKLRSPGVAASLGVLIALVALYASWVAWCHGLAARSGPADWVTDPVGLAGQITETLERGAWSIRSWTPTGTTLAVLWLAEAVVILLIPAIIAWTAAEEPFCERCGRWVRPEVSWLLGAIEDREALVTRLEGGDLQALGELEPTPGGRMTEATIRSCPECRQTAFLSLAAVERRRGKKAKLDKRELFAGLILGPAALATARELAELAELAGTNGSSH